MSDLPGWAGPALLAFAIGIGAVYAGRAVVGAVFDAAAWVVEVFWDVMDFLRRAFVMVCVIACVVLGSWAAYTHLLPHDQA